ncbi:putative permease [Desulfamplus magnetovallimortis]|uniref:Putative permease n=1 Tax=Desulfamplus magnetovallimortis TaxID=1246637 RepID=A0A1W1H8D2_9BACT|nr:LPS export ABC transporter permease LptG [Desulfamplus magnetovallimortis]SLM28750.1 putative permease [Desulfamplus magnetovallimortis]
MAILTQYWAKEFIKFFLIIQIIVMAIFISVDYLTNMDRFVKAGISFIDAFGYVLLKTPFMFVQLTPAGIVLAVVTVFGLMNRNNELMAMRAGGISVYYLLRPAIAWGLLLSFMMIFMGETVVPVTMSKANDIKYGVIKKTRNIHAVKEKIWLKGDGTIYYFRYFNPKDKTLAGITITWLDRDFSIIRRVDARTAQFDSVKQTWLFDSVLEQRFEDSSSSSIVKYDKKEIPIEFKPDDLQGVVKKSDEMSFTELLSYIRKIQKEGYDATTYKVDLYGKTAFPFICLIMALIGAGAGMRRIVKDNLPVGIVIGIAASFFYWFIYGFFTSLGYGRMLPPAVSAWITNLIFMLLAMIYIISSEQ